MGTRNINALRDDINPDNINNIIDINEGEVGENQQHLIPIEEQNQIVQERTISKKILTVRLPVNLDKKTLALEKDYIFRDKYYIKFNYDSLYDLDCYINFNVTEKSEISSKNNKYKLAYSPSEHFTETGFYLKGLKNGENTELYNPDIFIDIKNYLNEKIENQNSFDVCIEFVPLFPPGSPELADNNEIVFVTLCNFENHQDDNTYIIKCVKQRIRTHKIWIDLYDIFDSAMEGGLCLICCSERRNTIFLPCKHACCCNKCGSQIKYRFKPCPICKTDIDDLLIVNSDEKRIKILDEDEENIESSENLENTDSNIINTGSNNIINDSHATNENININEEEKLIPDSKNNDDNDNGNDNDDIKENISNDDNKNSNNIDNDIKEDIIDINNDINDNKENIENIDNDYIKIEEHEDKNE
mgnify:FL=1